MGYRVRVATAAGLTEAKQRLRSLGLKVTAPRLAVLRVLEQAERPLSHAEVVACVGGGLLAPGVSPGTPPRAASGWDRATVYRNLVALVGVGLVRISSHAGGICRYEIVREAKNCAHPHFVCDDCGVVSCLPEAEVVTKKKNTRWTKSLRAAEVQFVGRCPSCSG
jgi:Fur family ferric uptake transcriptional regulator